MEHRRKPRPIRFVDPIHTILRIGRKTSRWVYMVREAVDEEANDIQPDYLWPEIWKDMERYVRSSATKKKNKSGHQNGSLTTLEDCAVFTSLMQRMRSSKKLFKKARRKLEVPMPQQQCLARSGEESRRKLDKYKET